MRTFIMLIVAVSLVIGSVSTQAQVQDSFIKTIYTEHTRAQGGVCDLIQITVVIENDIVHSILEFEAPVAGTYYAAGWIQHALWEGKPLEYGIYLDDDPDPVGQFRVHENNWQYSPICELDNEELSSRIYITEGLHTLTVTNPIPIIPNIGYIRFGMSEQDAWIDDTQYRQHIEMLSQAPQAPDSATVFLTEGTTFEESVENGLMAIDVQELIPEDTAYIQALIDELPQPALSSMETGLEELHELMQTEFVQSSGYLLLKESAEYIGFVEYVRNNDALVLPYLFMEYVNGNDMARPVITDVTSEQFQSLHKEITDNSRVIRYKQNGAYISPNIKANMIRYIIGILNSDYYEWAIPRDSVTHLSDQAPGPFKLRQASPNPFNPQTTISFTLPEASAVTLSVYNVPGQKVATLVDDYLTAGSHSAVFDGSGLASGIYFYRLDAGSTAEVHKMVLVK